ncbi:MAG: hypothetical protein VXY77_02160 [Pseudomonadota bacterium]|nr:hypothetical protein [Pseudomonadota bacterium]
MVRDTLVTLFYQIMRTVCFGLMIWANVLSIVYAEQVPSFCVVPLKRQQKQCRLLETPSFQLLSDTSLFSCLDSEANVRIDQDHLHFSADHWVVDHKNLMSYASGEVSFQYQQQQIKADNMWLWLTPERKPKRVCFKDNIHWYFRDWHFCANYVAYVNLPYWFACQSVFSMKGDDTLLKGTAVQVLKKANGDMSMKKVALTSCPLDDLAWHMAIDELSVDSNRFFEAKRLVLYLRRHRLLAVPYLRLPVSSTHHSTWLLPRIKSLGHDGTGLMLTYRNHVTDSQRLWLSSFLTLKPAVGFQVRHQRKSDIYDAEGTYVLSKSKGGDHLTWGLVEKGSVTVDMAGLKWYWVSMNNGLLPAQLSSVMEHMSSWFPYKDIKRYISARTSIWGLKLQAYTSHYLRFSRFDHQLPSLDEVIAIKMSTNEKARFHSNIRYSHAVMPKNEGMPFKHNYIRGLAYVGMNLPQISLANWPSAHLGFWYRMSSYQKFVLPNIEVSVPLLAKQYIDLGMDYAYTKTKPQQERVLKWPKNVWPRHLIERGDGFNLSRVLDRHWMKLNVVGKLDEHKKLGLIYYYAITKPAVFLSKTGVENPLVSHPYTTWGMYLEWKSIKFNGIYAGLDHEITSYLSIGDEDSFYLKYKSGLNHPYVDDGQLTAIRYRSFDSQWPLTVGNRMFGLKANLSGYHHYDFSVGVEYRVNHACYQMKTFVGLKKWNIASYNRVWPVVKWSYQFNGLNFSDIKN